MLPYPRSIVTKDSIDMKRYEMPEPCLWTIDSAGIVWQVNPLSREALPAVEINALSASSQRQLLDHIWYC